MHFGRMALLVTGMMILGGCSNADQATVPTGPAVSVSVAGLTGLSTRGAELFGQCRACHASQAGRNGIGPTLHGVIGREAGSVAGYPYSAANKNSHLRWDAATVHRYLEAPMRAIPGTKMAYAVGDAQDRADIVAYLSTLR